MGSNNTASSLECLVIDALPPGELYSGGSRLREGTLEVDEFSAPVNVIVNALSHSTLQPDLHVAEVCVPVLAVEQDALCPLWGHRHPLVHLPIHTQVTTPASKTNLLYGWK